MSPAPTKTGSEPGVVENVQVGLNVVVDVGHHDAYAVPRCILPDCARRLGGLPVLFVGVRCPLDIIMERRRATGWNTTDPADAPVPLPVQLWQREVHRPGIYDLEVDTSALSPAECAAAIRHRLTVVGVANGDFRLPAGSPYRRAATDRTDIGADVAAVDSATRGAVVSAETVRR